MKIIKNNIKKMLLISLALLSAAIMYHQVVSDEDTNVSALESEVVINFIANQEKYLTLNMNIGDTVEVPSVVKVGYEFNGWFLDEEFKIKLETEVFEAIEDKNIFAKLTARLNTITFDASGGTMMIHTIMVKNHDTIGFEIPVLEARNFSGWYFGDQLIDESTPITSDMHLVAKWDVAYFTYTFILVTNDSSVEPIRLKVVPNSPVEPFIPTRDGFVFRKFVVITLSPSGYAYFQDFDFSVLPQRDMTINTFWSEVK